MSILFEHKGKFKSNKAFCCNERTVNIWSGLFDDILRRAKRLKDSENIGRHFPPPQNECPVHALPSKLIAVNESYLRVMKMTASILHSIFCVRTEPQRMVKNHLHMIYYRFDAYFKCNAARHTQTF